MKYLLSFLVILSGCTEESKVITPPSPKQKVEERTVESLKVTEPAKEFAKNFKPQLEEKLSRDFNKDDLWVLSKHIDQACNAVKEGYIVNRQEMLKEIRQHNNSVGFEKQTGMLRFNRWLGDELYQGYRQGNLNTLGDMNYVFRMISATIKEKV
jgi:hypothetical protein